jgi:hypothetical protein
MKLAFAIYVIVLVGGFIAYEEISYWLSKRK